MDKVRSSKSELIDNSNFVDTYISKLRPSEDNVDWKSNPQLRLDYCKRVSNGGGGGRVL